MGVGGLFINALNGNNTPSLVPTSNVLVAKQFGEEEKEEGEEEKAQET